MMIEIYSYQAIQPVIEETSAWGMCSCIQAKYDGPQKWTTMLK